MTARGKVIELCGRGAAVVRVERESACGKSCASCGGCDKRTIEVKAFNRAGAEPGDMVEVESSTRQTLWLCFLTYLLPVVLFIAGWLAHPAAGIASLAVSGVLIYYSNRRLKAAGGLKMEIVRMTGKGRCSDM